MRKNFIFNLMNRIYFFSKCTVIVKVNGSCMFGAAGQQETVEVDECFRNTCLGFRLIGDR